MALIKSWDDFKSAILDLSVFLDLSDPGIIISFSHMTLHATCLRYSNCKVIIEMQIGSKNQVDMDLAQLLVKKI